MPYVVTDACIQCGACEAGCENGAIHDGANKSEIDLSLCIECGTCAQNCPSEAIIFVEEGTTEAKAAAGKEKDPVASV